MHDIIIIGTGSLARSICYALPLITKNEQKIIVLGRSLKAAREVATVSNIRAISVNSKVTFSAQSIDWENKSNLKEVLIDTQGKIVLLASSLQSPWEFSNNYSEWSLLVKKAGFGVTLPLQAFLAVKVGLLLKEYNFQGLFLNACYPDAVNPLLKALNLNIACGIGNISILSAFLKSLMKPDEKDKFKMLAHHFHIGLDIKDKEESNIFCWINDQPTLIDNAIYTLMANVNGVELNQITGLTAAQMLVDLLGEQVINRHAPGPHGLPGGYPITVGNLQIKINLPNNVPLEVATSKNQEWAMQDGVLINDDKQVKFSHQASHSLLNYKFPFSNGFDVSETYEVCATLVNLRDKLRKETIQ